MFSVAQKRDIAEQVQRILRETNHPELPAGEIHFTLNVVGAEPEWSWATIQNNGDVPTPEVNPWNEAQDKCPAHLNGNPPPTCRLKAGHSGKHESVEKHGILSWPQDLPNGKPLC